MNSSPKVSIIVPCYNHRIFIEKLIDSIYRQTFKDFELIVLDDGSKDGSAELLKTLSEKHHFYLKIKDNEGLCKTLNQGLALAKGEYITIIASDDFIPEYRLEEQVNFFNDRPEIDVVAGCMTVVDINNNETNYKNTAVKGLVSLHEMLKRNRVFAATAMIRMSTYKKFGNYNENHVFEDFGMWLKILKGNGKIFNTSQMWAFYRIDNRDLERKFNWYFKGIMQVLEDYSDYPSIKQIRYRHTMTFLIKVALLLGNEAVKKYPKVYTSVDLKGRILVNLVSLSPSIIRQGVMTFLKLRS